MSQIHGSYFGGGFPTQPVGGLPFPFTPEMRYLSPVATAEVMEMRRQREALEAAKYVESLDGEGREQALREAGLLPPEAPQQPSLKQRTLGLLKELLLVFLRELVGALGRYLPLLALGYLLHLQLLSVEELLQQLLDRLTGWFEKTPPELPAVLEAAETMAAVEAVENHSGSW